MTIQIPTAENLDVTKLKVDGDNPNRMTPKQLERLKTSIEKYGFVVPIITNKDLVVADGQQRLTAAQQLRMTKVPVIRLPIEDVDRRLLRQVLNKLRGEHELVADALEFEKIIGAGHEDELKHLLDLSDSQLERYLAEIREPQEESYEIPEIDKIKTDIKRGDILKLGQHRLMCGDTTSKADVTKLMNGQKADMVFTDPPYVAFGTSTGLSADIVDDKMVRPFFRAFLQNIRAFTKYWGHIYIFTGWKTFPSLYDENKSVGLSPKNLIVWHKRNARLGAMYSRSYELIFFLSNNPPKKYLHPRREIAREKTVYGETNVWDILMETGKRLIYSEKPLALSLRAIKNSSVNPNIVLDLFGGSGSTLIACEQTGRRCYMMEIDPRYCQVIVDRWQGYTGQKAEKLS